MCTRRRPLSLWWTTDGARRQRLATRLCLSTEWVAEFGGAGIGPFDGEFQFFGFDSTKRSKLLNRFYFYGK